ncbi:MAG: energy transducer TonB [Alphaproteobacteria bacterium]
MFNEQKKIDLAHLPRRAAEVVDIRRRPIPVRLLGHVPMGRPKPPMKRPLIISAALHAALLLFLWIGLPNFLPPLPPPLVIIPVDITDVAAMTNTRLKSDKDPEPQPAPPPKQAEKATPLPPPPPEEQSKPQPAPPPPPETKAPEPVPEQKPEQKKPEPQKVEEKPKPKPDLLSSVLKNVAKLKPAPTAKTPDQTDKQEEAQERPDAAPSLSDKLSISEEDALRRQMIQCWNMPIGARNAEQLIVEITIDVNPDRTVRAARVVDTARMGSDPFFRAAAESALRAVRNPLCSPLALPEGKYEQWKVIHFNFDPRDML